WRDNVPLLIATRQSTRPGSMPRTVAFVQPMDDEWIAQLGDHNGMSVRVGKSVKHRRTRSGGASVSIDVDNEKDTDDLLFLSIRRKIVWVDTATHPRPG